MKTVTAKDVKAAINIVEEGYSDTFSSAAFEVEENQMAVHAWYRKRFGSDFAPGETFGREIEGLDEALLGQAEDDARLDSLWAEVFNLTESLNASFWRDMAECLEIEEEREREKDAPPPPPLPPVGPNGEGRGWVDGPCIDFDLETGEMQFRGEGWEHDGNIHMLRPTDPPPDDEDS